MIDQERRVINISGFRSPKLIDIPTAEKKYSLFYDETNNIRKLALTETGLNQDALDCFVLGGVALNPGVELNGVSQLKRELHIPANAPEMKFRHLAWGTYEKVLSSARLGLFLEWMLASPVYIHFSNFSVLNWSIVDLVDSILAEEQFRELQSYHMDLKNELHSIVRQDPLGYFRLLKTFDYPNVAHERTGEFVKTVRTYLSSKIRGFRNPAAMAFFDMLADAAKGTKLAFLVDNEPDTLVGSFHGVFLDRLATFRNAQHVFDEEPQIERELRRFQIMDGELELTYRFANSKTEPGIELSDVLCGLLGKHFSFLEKNTIDELEVKKAAFNAQQLSNLKLLARLIDKANDECQCFLRNLAPLDSGFKNAWFVDGEEYPDENRY
ncbi:DUF3800 domain-containing protein [Variovorax fucosicus]|uniref:DUF3800 domain-containing protein n=1 Tax=Variovorax fucosicus TaxID=3053517 RepID=UPI00257832F3|nr:DUF3800 domain-containing protein [Variovorax sp. J22G47]MDM0055230.1 DUF3800 domain-containing protein [Variovorax sp. J22G47]